MLLNLITERPAPLYLGVVFKERGGSVDPDTTTTPGMYRSGSTPGFGVLCVFRNATNGFVAQVVITGDSILYRRSKNEDGGATGFNAWKTITGE